jgi:hypothetical protein
MGRVRLMVFLSWLSVACFPALAAANIGARFARGSDSG